MTNEFFSPETTHVADTLPSGETLVAYGWWTDDLQAVITLLPRPQMRGIVHAGRLESGEEWTEQGPQNYCTFFIDSTGKRTLVQYHANIVHAVHRYEEEMGMDV